MKLIICTHQIVQHIKCIVIEVEEICMSEFCAHNKKGHSYKDCIANYLTP